MTRRSARLVRALLPAICCGYLIAGSGLVSLAGALDDCGRFLAQVDNNAPDKARNLIPGISDLNEPCADGLTLLMALARRGPENPGLLRELANAGADPNIRNSSGLTALDLAIRGGRLENAKMLIELGANSPRAKSLAEREGYFEIVQLLQSAQREGSEELNERLHRSIRRQADFEVIRGLVLSGADLDAAYLGGSAPINTALAAERHDVVQLLLESGADPNGGRVSFPPIAWAARQNDIEIARILIEAGADLDRIGAAKSTALMAAAEFGHQEMVDLLLDHGADPNVGNDQGHTPLMIAENQFRSSIAARLRAAGAKPRPNTLPSPLFTPADPERVQELIDQGADVNARNEWGATVLNRAIEQRRVEVVRILVSNGAKLNYESRMFQNPPILAVAMATSYFDEHVEMLKILLENGANPDVRHFQHGQTPLHFAANRHGWQLVSLLMEAGASPDIPDNHGKTVRRILQEKGREIPES